MKSGEGAIYTPPRSGLPFLVVSFTASGVLATPATTRLEARVIASRQRTARGTRAPSSPDARATEAHGEPRPGSPLTPPV
jgi:hypothetical protein